MAQRRMFNKSITNSSVFLKMPVSSRLLYYDLGMNADDDGFVEHFMVLRMTGATQQDLGVLEINGLIKVFDDNVLWIKDWKENNYIQKDRYCPSKYLAIYGLDTLCIQDVDTGKDSIGKLSIDNNIYKQEFEKLWTLYPKKQGKSNALKSYIKSRKKYTYEEIEKGLNNYNTYIKNNFIKPQFIKQGSTWFNQECWNDEYDNKTNEPKWFNKDIKREEPTEEELKEMEEIQKKFNDLFKGE